MNPNHDEMGRFSEGDSDHHAERATEHAGKARTEARAALVTKNVKTSEKHLAKAKEHHQRSKDHAEAAHHKAHGAGDQIKAHVAHEHAHDPNLLQMLASASEHVATLGEAGEKK